MKANSFVLVLSSRHVCCLALDEDMNKDASFQQERLSSSIRLYIDFVREMTNLFLEKTSTSCLLHRQVKIEKML